MIQPEHFNTIAVTLMVPWTIAEQVQPVPVEVELICRTGGALALHDYRDPTLCWKLMHVPTGLGLPCLFASRQDALEWVDRLWTRLTPDEQHHLQRDKRPEMARHQLSRAWEQLRTSSLIDSLEETEASDAS